MTLLISFLVAVSLAAGCGLILLAVLAARGQHPPAPRGQRTTGHTDAPAAVQQLRDHDTATAAVALRCLIDHGDTPNHRTPAGKEHQ